MTIVLERPQTLAPTRRSLRKSRYDTVSSSTREMLRSVAGDHLGRCNERRATLMFDPVIMLLTRDGNSVDVQVYLPDWQKKSHETSHAATIRYGQSGIEEILLVISDDRSMKTQPEKFSAVERNIFSVVNRRAGEPHLNVRGITQECVAILLSTP